MNTIAKIANFITTELNQGNNIPSLGHNQSLLASGLLDSISVLQLVDFVEREFNIQLKMEDVTMENFESLQAISRLLEVYGVANG